MRRLLIHLYEQTLAALNRLAGRSKGKTSEFIRQAIRQAEYRAIRDGYGKEPDSLADADDWSTAEEYRA